jgi:hypothetical protein
VPTGPVEKPPDPEAGPGLELVPIIIAAVIQWLRNRWRDGQRSEGESAAGGRQAG